MIRYGNISEIDAATGRARVHFVEDDIVSDWLPVSVPTSLGNQFELWPELNMFVWCVMDENAESGVIGGALYDSSNTPPVGDAEKSVITFKDGTRITYDRADKILEIDCVNEITVKCQSAAIEAASGVMITTPNMEVSGNIKAQGEITAKFNSLPVNLSTHIHPTPAGPSSSPTPGT